MNPVEIGAAFAAADVRNEVEHILTSEGFSHSPRLQRFLTYIVDRTLEGRAHEIKEYAIAVDVFDRSDFDGRTDTIVRVEARRLRQQLANYYNGPGAASGLLIELPKGGYTPLVRPRDPVESKSPIGKSRFRRFLIGVGLLALFAIAIAATRSFMASRAGAGPLSPASARTNLWEARYHRAQRTPEALEKSLEAYERAVAADPSSSEAWSGLASTCATLGFQGLAHDGLATGRAGQAAQKAIQLDEHNAEAHGVLGWILFFHDRDWPGAERELRRAIDLDRRYATAHEWYAFGLAAHRRFDEAIAHARTAADLDANLAAGPDLAVILYFSGRIREAMEENGRVLRLQPGLAPAIVALGSCRAALGNHEAAIEEYRKALGPSDRFSTVLGRLGLSCARAGHAAEAQSLQQRLSEAARRGARNNTEQALIFTGQGDSAHAVQALERATEAGESDVLFLSVDPLFGPLHGDPAFRALCARLSLPLPPAAE